MSESYVEVREDGSVRLAGTLAYPEATVADVLTVQADGSIAAAAGGGSSPFLGPYTIAWDTPNLASDYVEIALLPAGAFLFAVRVVVIEAWDAGGFLTLVSDALGDNPLWRSNAALEDQTPGDIGVLPGGGTNNNVNLVGVLCAGGSTGIFATIDSAAATGEVQMYALAYVPT